MYKCNYLTPSIIRYAKLYTYIHIYIYICICKCTLLHVYIHIEPAISAGEGGIHDLHAVEDAADEGSDEVH